VLGVQASRPEDCFRAFEEHMHGVLRRVLQIPAYVRFKALSQADAQRAVLTLRVGGGDKAVAVQVSHEPTTFLAIRQDLLAVPVETGGFRLRTTSYRYALTPDDEPRSKAFVRWEFDQGNHHVQVPANPADVGGLDLNRLHLPTGWVPLERVLRFVIVELHVVPPCGPGEADDLLLKSERKFYEQFVDADDLLGLADRR
jgi:hypothetical protein